MRTNSRSVHAFGIFPVIIAGLLAILLVGCRTYGEERPLVGGETVRIEDAGLALRVPPHATASEWTYRQSMVPNPRNEAPLFEGTRSEVVLQDGEVYLTVSVFSDFDVYARTRSDWETRSSRPPLGLGKTPFGKGGWTAVSSELGTSSSVMLYVDDAGAGLPAGVVLSIVEPESLPTDDEMRALLNEFFVDD